MVGAVTGVGLGLERSSANLLGANGLLGSPGFGEGPDDVYVNAVNGNLVILRTDQILAGIGPNDVVSEAYNSQGAYTAALGGTGDSWMGDYQRGVSNLTGTVNAAGSTITRTAADGSQVVYTYQTTGQYSGLYIGYENAGATDTLSYSSGTNRWTWTDGNSQSTETYDWANGGRIMFATDLNGNKLTYTYTAAQLTSITTTDSGSQDTTSFVYNGSGQLTSIATSYWDISSGSRKTLTQEYYGYDAQGRLSTVTIDLSPTDNAITDGNKFTTTYGYQSTANNLITSITGSDGSSLTIGYFTGTSKVQTVAQTVATGVTRTTTFSNTYASGVETVTDPLGTQNTLTYTTTGTVGLLTQLSADVSDGAGDDLDQITKFGGWTNLNVGTVTDPDNTVVTYGHNASGDLTSQTDAASDVTSWTYGSLNQLLATTLTPATGVTDTSYDIYDARNNLLFTVTQQGVVTQYLYSALPGQVTSVIQYTNDTFNTAGYSAASPPSLGTLTTWATTTVTDKQNTKRTDYVYDTRGDVASISQFGADDASGNGIVSATEESVDNYVYDSADRVVNYTPNAAKVAYSYLANGTSLQRLPTNPAGAVTTYDGLGRVTSSTDLDGATTLYAYSLTSSSSYSVNDAGTVTLTTRDDAGEVASTTAYAKQLTPAQLTALGLTPTFTAVAADVTVTAGSDETTSYKYDADGRLMMVTDPKGNKAYDLYDTLGRKTADINALGDVTEYGYNADNQVNETIQYATPLTSGTLTTLTNASITAPVSIDTVRPAAAGADRYSWSVYDTAHRLVQTIDGLGSVTAYAYDKASNLISTTKYATQVALTPLKATPPTTPVTVTPATSDRTTRNFYDGDQRLIGSLDPDGFVTEIIFDSAGQKTRTIAFDTPATSSLWATGTWAQLLTSVGTATATDGNNWFVYDARGDLRGKVDADGDVTQYHYDPLGDVDETIAGQTLSVATLLTTPPTMATLTGLSTTGAAITDLTFNFKGQAVTTRNDVVTAPVTNTYDTLGNLIETVDPKGNKTFFYYDAFNRKIAELSAVGTLTTWAYDQDDNVTSETTYGDAVALPGSPGGTPPAPTVNNDFRRTSYTYDADSRVTVTTVTAGGGTFAYGNDTIEIGSWNGSSYATSTPAGGLTSHTYYDAFGNVWKSLDANGNDTYAFYNAVGQKIASVDGDNYLTGYNLDAFWDVGSQTQSATALSQTTINNFTAATDNVAPTPTPNGNDRTTSFTYDGDGDVLTQTRAGVAYATISADVVTSHAGINSTVTDTYNFLGEKLTEKQATLDTTTYAYTAAGRLSKVTSPSYTDAAGGTDTPQSVYTYNGLGLVTSIASGQSGSPTRTTTNTYDAIGRKTSLTDAANFTQYYAYDNDGNLTSVDYLLASSTSTTGAAQTTVGGHSVNERVVYTYNAVNEQLTQATSDWSGTAWVSGDPTSTTYDTANLKYDAYGEVVAKGINGLYQEAMGYDGAGRLVESNEGTGSPTYMLYDGDGHMTARIASAGTSFYTSGVLDTLAQALSTASGGVALGSSYVAGVEVTLSAYDAKGQATSVIQPFQQINSAAPTSSNTYSTSVTYDAFGDATVTTNNLGATTTNTYDTLGELTQSVAASVTLYSASSPTGFSATPTTKRFYDLSGRLIATEDANGSYTTQVLLAGTGYGGSQADVVQQFLPDLGNLSIGYDVFGDQTKVTDQIGRVTTKTYDGMGRMLTQTLPADATNGDAALVDFYAYDGLGQRVAQTNSALNALTVSGYASSTLIASTGAKQTTDYDSQGRIVATEDEMRTFETTYDYSWSGTQTTAGMGPNGAAATFGGWTETQKQYQLLNTVNEYGFTTFSSTTPIRTETTTSDFFNDTVGQTDFGGNTYTYAYNAAGNLATQTNSLGQNLAYTYFNTGQTYQIKSGPAGSQMVTTYGYDAMGEKLSETQALGSTSYENETATYDVMGWLTGVTDQGLSGTHPMSVTYGYDANGNVVTTTSDYTTLTGNGTTSSTTTAAVTYWNTYDQMNRQLIANGTLVSGTITRGETGTDIMYDKAGERMAASTMTETCANNIWYDAVHTEWYSYTADGYLETVQIADTDVADPSLPLSVGIDDSAAPLSGAYLAESNVYNSQGQLTSQTQDTAANQAVYIRSGIQYDADGQVMFDYIEQVINGTDTQYQDEYFYDSTTGANSTNTYQGGQLTLAATVQRSAGHAWVYGNAYSYIWTTQALQSQIAYNNGATTTTYLTYDGNNDLTTVSVGGTSNVSYVYNANNEILDRTFSGGSTVAAEYFYISGNQIGQVGNAGPDQSNYAQTINNEANPAAPPQTNSGDIGNTYVELGNNAPGAAAGSYTVQAGDTLQSIAQNLYGDSSLWYLIADANGLPAAGGLAPGQTVSLPNQVINAGNTSSTFRPYNATQATGNIAPGARAHHNNGCGSIGAILAVIVGVAVAILTYGALSGLVGLSNVLDVADGIADLTPLQLVEVGAAAGVAGNVANQVVQLATGAESSFNWAGVGMAAIGGAVSGGLNPELGGLDDALGGTDSFAATFANGAIDNLVTQGIGVATGLQKSFDWTSVATSGVEGAVGGALGSATNNPFIGSVGALLAGATARTLLTGENFGQSLVDEAPNTVAASIGSEVGDAIGSAIDTALDAGAADKSDGGATPNGGITDQQLEADGIAPGGPLDPRDPGGVATADSSGSSYSDGSSALTAALPLGLPANGNTGPLGVSLPGLHTPELDLFYSHFDDAEDNFNVDLNAINDPNWFAIGAHGNSTNIGVETSPGVDSVISMGELEREMVSSGNYKAGSPIILLSCNTANTSTWNGPNNVPPAIQLAIDEHAFVLAPEGYVFYNNIAPDGTLTFNTRTGETQTSGVPTVFALIDPSGHIVDTYSSVQVSAGQVSLIGETRVSHK